MNTPVSSELAKLLKEKRFDVPVRNYYLQKEKGNYLHEGFEDSYWGDYRIVNWNKDVVGIKPFEGFLSAPTIAEVVMWLYEKHGIWVYLVPAEDNKEVFKPFFRGKNIIDQHLTEFFESPTEAYEAAIDYTLKNLI